MKSEFEDFVRRNNDILGNIKPLSAAERREAEFERQNGFINKKKQEQSFITPLDKVLHFAKKNKKCPALEACMYGWAVHNSKEYRVKITGKPLIYRPKKKEKVQLMDYEEAARNFWGNYLKPSVLPKQFKIDDDNREAIKQMLKYFIQDPSCLLDMNKGICVAGGVGTGKTNLLKRLSEFTKDNNLDTLFEVAPMRKIIREASGPKGLTAVNDYLMGDFCFDDIAIKQTTVKSFGTEISPLDELIQERYDRFIKRNSRPTHFTTNMDFNPTNENDYRTLRTMYDERSLDRIKEMCNFIYLGGKSRRS